MRNAILYLINVVALALTIIVLLITIKRITTWEQQNNKIELEISNLKGIVIQNQNYIVSNRTVIALNKQLIQEIQNIEEEQNKELENIRRSK